MSTIVADLIARLGLNSVDFENGMNRVQNNLFSMANIAKVAFAKIAYEGAQAFTSLGKNAIEYASDLAELDNVLSVTFGDRMNVMALNADAMGRAMGRSSLFMRSMVSQAGALGKGLGFVGDDLENMSIQLAKTAVDMGSFFNVADEEAFTALRAALTGETEPMKRFGVVMTENNLKAYALAKGVKVLWKDMTEAEKTQVRYNYMLEKTSFFAGDAERTIKSTANQAKVLKAKLGELYNVIGQQVEPVWNEFLGVLVDSIAEIIEAEENTHGLATAMETLLDSAKIGIKGLKEIIIWYQKFSALIGNPLEKTTVNNKFEDILKNEKEFIKKRQDIVKKDADLEKQRNNNLQMQRDIGNGKLKKSNEETKKIQEDLKRINTEQFEFRKTALEDFETFQSTAYDDMLENTKTSLEQMIEANRIAGNKIGQSLIDTLGFYIEFTKGMSKEIKKQISVIAGLGDAKSYIEIELKKFSDKGIRPTAKQTSDIYKKAGEIGQSGYEKTFSTISLKTGDSEKMLTDLAKKFNLTPYKFNDDDSWSNNIVGNGRVKNDSSLTLRQLKKQYDEQLRIAKEYHESRKTSELDYNKELLNINDSTLKTALENKWFDYSETIAKTSNELENTIATQEEANKKEKESLELADALANIEYDKAMKALEDYENEQIKKAEAQKSIMEDVFSTVTNSSSVENLKSNYNLLTEKYHDNAEAMELLNKLYPDFLENLDVEVKKVTNLSQVFSDTSKIAEELATMFEDDLLGAMSSVLGTAGNLISQLESGNTLGAITTGLSFINQMLSAGKDAESDISKMREDSEENFKNAVDKFEQSVKSMNTTQNISLANILKGNAKLSTSDVITETGTITGWHKPSSLTNWGGMLDTKTEKINFSSINKLIKEKTGLDIDSSAIFGKYSSQTYAGTTKELGFGSKQYATNYDEIGAIAEINKIISEAWEKNIKVFKENLGLATGDFTNKLIEAFKSGGSVSESVNDMFYNAIVQAFFAQEAFEALNKNLGNAISETILNELTTEGINLGIDFKGMTPSEMLEAYSEIFGASSEKLSALLDKLGTSAKKASDQLNQVSTKNLPSGLKVASAAFQATNSNYNSSNTTIYQIENNYSKDFADMVAQTQNRSRFTQTNNVRRSY